MKRLMLLILFCLVPGFTAFAQAAATLSYQGVLTNATGDPIAVRMNLKMFCFNIQ